MALYSRPVRLLMQDMVIELSKGSTAIFTKQMAIQWFSTHYPKIKTGTVTAHLIRLSTNAQSRIHYGAKAGEDDILYQIDGSHFRPYRPAEDPQPISSVQPTNVTDSEEDNDLSEFSQ